jgi:uncharacterized RDD family membrane protein YckC
MKCPKCGYLGFEHAVRCRNCGYDFSLSSTPEIPDLPIRPNRGDALQPLADLTLLDSAAGSPLPGVQAARTASQPPDQGRGSAELPLFATSRGAAASLDPSADDAPLITKASPPRTPLAVRRGTPEVPRLRADLRVPMLELASSSESDSSASRPVTARGIDRAFAPGSAPRTLDAPETASPTSRLYATAIDVALLAAIDAAVIYFTLQICGLRLDEFDLVPKAPLVTFLTLQNVAYFIAFTAEGHTLGQMAAGIRVVAGDAHKSPDLRLAVVRTVIWLALAVPAGIGLLSVLFSRDRRGFHDRCAGTRVVRAGA